MRKEAEIEDMEEDQSVHVTLQMIERKSGTEQDEEAVLEQKVYKALSGSD